MPASEELKNIGRRFGKECSFRPTGAGHIHDTYLSDDGQWILQRINTKIFVKPQEVMENIEAVTAYIRKRLEEEETPSSEKVLTVVPTMDGELLYEDETGCWRMYENISGTHSVEPEERSLGEFAKAGAAFGRFQLLLSGFPASELHVTIPDFHNTIKYLQKLENTVRRLSDEKDSPEGLRQRLRTALPLVSFVSERRELAAVVLRGLEDGSIPYAVTHNDTKINNVLFDNLTGEAAAVIDLDTVMSGSRLYDFGDAIRSGAVTAAEDEPDEKKVHFDPAAYRAFKNAYLSVMSSVLTPAEKRLLFDSAMLLTYECGIRFLTDYLEGDVYFKTTYPEHNLVRARNQFAVLKEMEACREKEGEESV